MGCPDDATLNALIEGELHAEALPAIDAHLDECSSCRDVVATLASGPRLKRRLEPGAKVGRFVLEEPIGEGAMGAVYAALDPELGRRVAIKRLHPEVDAERARARLVREAQSMAKLAHPHVVTVFEVGTLQDEGSGEETVFVAMELVEGSSLRQWLTQKPDRDAVLVALRDAASGLRAAHEAGLVHRDFKPDNVLVDAQGRAKVTDFGLAFESSRPPDQASPPGLPKSAPTMTRTGALLGTPAYMAPEQLDGQPADARSDQFAFCVSAWEALFGTRPFQGNTIAELQASIADGPPAVRTSAVLKKLVTHLRRGLSHDPADRHDSVAALERALVLPSRRLGWAVAAVAALAPIALFAAMQSDAPCETPGGLLEWAPGQEEAATNAWGADAAALVPRIAQFMARFNDARRGVCEATHVRREQSDVLLDRRMACLDRAATSFGWVLSETIENEDGEFVLTALPDLEVCAGLLEGVEPIPETSQALANDLERWSVALQLASSAPSADEVASMRARAAATGHHGLHVDAQLMAGSASAARGDWTTSEAETQEALLLAEAQTDPGRVARAWLQAARISGERGRYAEAEERARHAVAQADRAGERQLSIRAGLVRVIALTHLERFDRATEVLATLDAQEDVGPLLAARIETSRGDLLRRQAFCDEALAAHERALELDRSELGPTHPRLARHHHNRGGVLREAGRLEDAREAYEAALALWPPASLGFARTTNSLGLVDRSEGQPVRARERFEGAFQILTALEHADASQPRFNLAKLDIDGDDPGHGLASLQALLAEVEPRFGDSSRVLEIRMAMAEAYDRLDRPEDARAERLGAAALAERLGRDDIAETIRGAAPTLEATEAVEPSTAPTPMRRARPGETASATRTRTTMDATETQADPAPAVTETAEPTMQPTIEPTMQPTMQPTVQPTMQATRGGSGSSYMPDPAWQ